MALVYYASRYLFVGTSISRSRAAALSLRRESAYQHFFEIERRRLRVFQKGSMEAAELSDAHSIIDGTFILRTPSTRAEWLRCARKNEAMQILN